MGEDYNCKDCSYFWTSRKSIGEPAKCPRCNSKSIFALKPAPTIPTTSPLCLNCGNFINQMGKCPSCNTRAKKNNKV